MRFQLVEAARLAEDLRQLGEVRKHLGVLAVRSLAELRRAMREPLGVDEAAFQQRAHPTEQRHVPQRDRLLELLGQAGEGFDLAVEASDIADLE